MQQYKKVLQTWSKPIGIILFLFFAFAAGNTSSFLQTSRPRVLGIQTHKTASPTPTVAPTSAPVTIINNIIMPTQTPISVAPSPTPTPIVILITPTPTPTAQPTTEVTSTPTSTPTPTPIAKTVTITIDYAGEHQQSTYTATIVAGESAWQAIQDAIGIANIHYTDYGGSLGIFITGFNEVDATSNQYFDFQVNGISSSVGVSSYTVVDGDALKFVLTGF